jgi:hypothetical protein
MRAIFAKIGDQLFTHPLESLCDSFFVFYSLWTLTWIASYFANLSLSAISPIFFLLLPLSLLALALKPPTGQRTAIAASRARRDTLIVVVFVIAGILLTLFLHRPDSDDELYLGMAFSLLANAHEPIQELPGYGNIFYAVSAYEPFKAMVSYTTDLPLLKSYYLVCPALISALTVIVTYRLLRELIPEGWIIGILFFFLVMLAWGDAHRTLANFGFVRMYQGKSALVSAVVPALLLYVFLLRDKAQARYYGFLIAATLLSGVGFSRGGLVIGSLVLVFLGLAYINFRTLGKFQAWLLIITGVLAATLLLLAYHFGWTLMNESQLVFTGRGSVTSTTNLEMVGFTMGDGFRGMFLLTCVGLSALFVKDEKLRHPYRNYLLIFFILLLIPWTSNFFAKTAQEFLSWRWMWVMPVPVLASVSVGGAWVRIRQASNLRIALGAFVVLAIGFVAASHRLVVSGENGTSVRWPNAKINGDTIYLRPYNETAKIKNGMLWLDHYDRGF